MWLWAGRVCIRLCCHRWFQRGNICLRCRRRMLNRLSLSGIVSHSTSVRLMRRGRCTMFIVSSFVNALVGGRGGGENIHNSHQEYQANTQLLLPCRMQIPDNILRQNQRQQIKSEIHRCRCDDGFRDAPSTCPGYQRIPILLYRSAIHKF